MATLIRPAKGLDRELILKITPKRGEVFTRPELFSFVGVDFNMIELMSGDLLLTEKNQTGVRNLLGSKLSHREIFGTAIIAEKQEID